MSVENFADIGGAVAFLGDDTPEDCFFCGRPLDGITVYWHSASKSAGIAMHPDCATNLGVRLCRDGMNAKLVCEGKSPTSGISPGLRHDG